MRWIGLILSGLVLALPAGCASWPRRGPVADDVLAARQFTQRGMDALHQGRLEEARAQFDAALAKCSDDATARAQLAECLWQQGEDQQAIEQLTQAVHQGGGENPDLLVRLGFMHLAVEQVDQAFQLARRATRVAPRDPRGWHLRAAALQRQGDLQGALADYHRALAYDQGNPELQVAVAQTYLQQQRPQRAVATLDRLALQYPPDRQPMRVLHLQGLALHRIGRYEQALDHLLRARDRQPPSPQLLADLAEVQLALDDAAAAERSLEIARQQAGPEDNPRLAQLQDQVLQARGTSTRDRLR